MEDGDQKPVDGVLEDGAGPPTKRSAAGPSNADIAAEQRRARAAEKLRENLARRKQQVRARRAGLADETDGLPAAKDDPAAAKMDEL